MSKRTDRIVVLATSIGSVLLLNALAADHFLRADLTRDGAYTLSDASHDTMRDLEDPVIVTAYFSGDLPASFEGEKRYVKDLLEEYRAASHGMLSFEFIDPQSRETDEDREAKREVRRDIFGRRLREQTSVERELETLGIQPVEIRVIEDDAAQTQRAYLGMVIRYQEEQEVIPVVQRAAELEYDLTTLIRRLTRPRIPVLGVLQGNGEPGLDSELAQLQQLLSQNYEVRAVELAATAAGEADPAAGPAIAREIDPDVDALLVVGSRNPYDELALRAIDQFLMQGKGAAFLLDLIEMDLGSATPTPVEHGLGGLLSSYGLELGTQLVADAESASLAISERRGFMMVQIPVRYPFIPQSRFGVADSPITRGVTDLALPFVTPVKHVEREGVEYAALATSSEKSWLEPPEPWRLDPRRDWRQENVTVTGPYDLVVKANGLLPSHFARPGEVGQSTDDGLLSQSLEESRLVVVGTSAILREEFLNASSAGLVLNLVDWMLLDPAVLEMRTRGMAESPIEEDLSDTTRAVVKYGNVVGVPILLVLYGLIRRLGRERRRAALSRRVSADAVAANPEATPS